MKFADCSVLLSEHLQAIVEGIGDAERLCLGSVLAIRFRIVERLFQLLYRDDDALAFLKQVVLLTRLMSTAALYYGRCWTLDPPCNEL